MHARRQTGNQTRSNRPTDWFRGAWILWRVTRDSLLWTSIESNTRIISFPACLSDPPNCKTRPAGRQRQPSTAIYTDYWQYLPGYHNTHMMARNLLPIRILFHATFAFIYLPVVFLAFNLGARFSGETFHYANIFGFAPLTGLVIFAAL